MQKSGFTKKTGFEKLINGRGFYIALMICLLTVAIAGFVATRNMQEATVAAEGEDILYGETAGPTEGGLPVEAGEVLPIPAAEPEEILEPEPEPEPEETTAFNPVTPAPDPAQTPTPEEPEEKSFAKPINGAVLQNFSNTELTYSQTMKDWRTHPGIDYKADVGAPVLAVGPGMVSDVYLDEMYGYVVLIDHGDGLMSLYANLSPATAVSAGDEVQTGDVIGSVGESAAFESEMAPHLHFEMLKDGAQIDPMEYIE